MTTRRATFVGSVGALLIVLIPVEATAPVVLAGAMLAVWLIVASLVGLAATHGSARRPWIAIGPIPLRFSGPMGRFRLRKQGDGRVVEIVAEDVVLAEVRATDLRDEINLRQAVADDELEDLGSALGQAMDMVHDADLAHLDWDDHGADADLEDDHRSSGW
jgi:hypothetical protein